MAYVVTENCIKCKYTDCVDVCPVDCILKDEDNAESADQLWVKFERITGKTR